MDRICGIDMYMVDTYDRMENAFQKKIAGIGGCVPIRQSGDSLTGLSVSSRIIRFITITEISAEYSRTSWMRKPAMLSSAMNRLLSGRLLHWLKSVHLRTERKSGSKRRRACKKQVRMGILLEANKTDFNHTGTRKPYICLMDVQGAI